MIQTIFRYLPRAPFEQQTYSSAACLDELDGPAVTHIPCALTIYFNDLIAHLNTCTHMKKITV